MSSLNLFRASMLCLVLAGPCSFAQTSAAKKSAAAPAMTNDDVIGLATAGMGDDIILAKIHAAHSTAFDTSVSGLKALKAGGVSSTVIRVMIDPTAVVAAAPPPPPLSPAAPLPPPINSQEYIDDFNQPHDGVYVQLPGTDGGPHLTKLLSITPTDQKLGLGSALASSYTFGLVKAKNKAFIPGTKSDTETPIANPVFYYWSNGKSAEGLALVKFEVKGDRRTVTNLTIGSVFTGGANTGATSKEQVGFVAEQIQPSVFKITLSRPLEPGCYAFAAKGMAFTYYDFDILPSTPPAGQ